MAVPVMECILFTLEIKKLLLLTCSNDGTPISQLSKAQLQSPEQELRPFFTSWMNR